jgi:alkylation response protein AidB-like acyl-CoA dehydrogenase
MYRAPVDDMRFIIDEVLQVGDALGGLPRYADLGVGDDLTTALLDEAARLAGEVLAPLRRVGDTHPARCEDGRVQISPGYGEALKALAEGGWFGISADGEYGGQGLPEIYGTAAAEMWNSADMAFALAPFLSSGAALAIAAHGSDELKARYLDKLHSGEWTGTMNLTEAGAGSDLGPMKTRAEPTATTT